jgi:hypothetical protein
MLGQQPRDLFVTHLWIRGDLERVWPSLFSRWTLAPCSSSSLTALRLPYLDATCSGVEWSLFGALMSAPCSSKSRITPRQESAKVSSSPINDLSNGVQPSSFRASTFAPCSSRSCATLTPPNHDATCNGVELPMSACASTSAPCSSKIRTTSKYLPSNDVPSSMCSGVRSSMPRTSTSTQCRSDKSATLAWPLYNAVCNGVP